MIIIILPDMIIFGEWTVFLSMLKLMVNYRVLTAFSQTREQLRNNNNIIIIMFVWLIRALWLSALHLPINFVDQ